MSLLWAGFATLQTAFAAAYLRNAWHEWKRRALLSEECSYVLSMPPGEERHQRRMLLLKRLHDLESK